MRLIKNHWLLPLCVALGAVAQAQPGNAPAEAVLRPLTLDESVQMALERNLGLQIERLTPQLARYDLAGSYASYDPALKLSGEQSFRSSPGGFNPAINLPSQPNDTWQENFLTDISGTLPTGMRYDLSTSLNRVSGVSGGVDRGFQYRTDAGVTFAQPLLKNFWIDEARIAIKLNKRQVKISELALSLHVMDTVTKVKESYYDLIFARENVKVQEKALELARQLVDENKKRVQIGTLAPLDEKQAESQSAIALADLISARNQFGAAQNALKNLLTDDYRKLHGVTLDPTERIGAAPETFDLGTTWSNGLRLRPDYLQLKEELEKQNLILKFDYNQLFPALDLTGSVGRNGLDSNLGGAVEDIRGGDFPRWSGGAILTIPLSRTRERNNYQKTKATQKQALLRLKQLEQDIIVQIDDAVTLVRSNLQRVEATRLAREFAEAALDAEQKKLDNGKSTSFVVLGLQSNLTKARSAEIQALADYNKSLAELYFREGTTLEKSRLTIEVK